MIYQGTRQEYLASKFNEWLERFSPPRRIANNFDAQQKDADALLGIVVNFAPKEGYAEWLDAMLRNLEGGMTTRSWPAPGEVTKACKSGREVGASGPRMDDGMIEEAAIERMTQWFAKFGDQMPGHGRWQRTEELIKRGVQKDYREARFRGFELSPEANREAKKQRMGMDEWRHHVRVMARIWDVSEDDAEREIRRTAKDPVQMPEFKPKGFPTVPKPEDLHEDGGRKHVPHWSDGLPDDDPRMIQLRAARAKSQGVTE